MVSTKHDDRDLAVRKHFDSLTADQHRRDASATVGCHAYCIATELLGGHDDFLPDMFAAVRVAGAGTPASRAMPSIASKICLLNSASFFSRSSRVSVRAATLVA